MNHKLLLSVGSMLFAVATSLSAATPYSYRVESFEDAPWNTAAATVESSTGTWTSNKNVSVTTCANTGSKSLHFAQKTGLVLPELNRGAGMLIYYGYNGNREVHVETSTDNVNWKAVETHKTDEQQFVKHSVLINDENVRWVRIYTTSNKNFYIDDILVTLPDGTDADGNMIATTMMLPYFTQDFEDKSTYPASKDECAAEAVYNVTGQGEWRYLNAYRSTSETYNPAPSTADLRVLKNGGYVITPVVNQGVAYVKFAERRVGKQVNVYTSTDGGATWNLLNTVKTDSENVVYVGEPAVNRVKLQNDFGSDLDIDDITITAFPSGATAELALPTVGTITASTAVVSGRVVSAGDSEVTELGFCWSTTPGPGIDDNKVTCTGDAFTATLTDLPAETLIYCRAYALSLAGVAYSDELTFTTQAPKAPVVTFVEVAENEALSDDKEWALDLKGRVADNGGAPVTEVGFKLTINGKTTTLKGYSAEAGLFNATAKVAPETQVTIAAYATNKIGTTVSDAVTYTTGSIVVPEYRHQVFYCDPAGDDATADGSLERPFYNLQKAVDLVQPGDTIYMNAGTYRYTDRINISAIGERNSGRIALFSRGGRAVLDFSAQADADNNQGIRHVGSFWHFYGLDICGAGDNGMLVERNKPTGGTYADIAANVTQAHDNIIEFCHFYRNRDTGLQLKNLAADNLIINCDAYYNTDSTHGDADGFAVKLSHGDGNYFYGCRAWQNSDDGWDQFIKKEGGFPDDITTTLENCWAFRNGYLEDGSESKGNGNGFKMGSDQGRNNVIMNRCVAFENLNKSFDQNHNTGHMILNNCSGYASKIDGNKSNYSYRLDEAVASGHEIRLTNCVAIWDGETNRSKSAFGLCSVVGNIITSDLTTLPADYQSIDIAQMTGERDEMGYLPEVTFMHINEGNMKLIDAGSVVTPYAGESPYSVGIKFAGAAPDLGAFETDMKSGVQNVGIVESANTALTVTRARCGLIVISVAGANPTDTYRLTVVDAAGRVMESRQFNGSSTALTLAKGSGVAIVNVQGVNTNATVKLIP